MHVTVDHSGATFMKRHSAAAIWTLIGGLIFMSAAPLWWVWLQENVLPTALGGTANVSELRGGCPEGWQVYAQNRWTPVGAAVREHPNVDAEKIDSISPNVPFIVDGWVSTSIPYPYNSPPFDSDVWLHRKSGGGWVSFAGVRAVPTDFDPTLRSSDGGIPVPLPESCEGTVG